MILSRDELVQKIPPNTLAWVLGSEAFWDQLFDLKSSSTQSAHRGRQKHAEEFRSKKRGTFQAELSMFRSFLQGPESMQK